MIKFVLSVLLIGFATAFAQFEVPIPEPTEDNMVILDFANAVAGTDGTPQGIAAKNNAQVNRLAAAKDAEQVGGIQGFASSNPNAPKAPQKKPARKK